MEEPEATNEARDARLDYWLQRGASKRAANALSVAECDNLDHARDIGRNRFERISNCGAKTLREIGDLIGGWGTGPVEIVRSSLEETIPEPDRERIASRIVALLMQHGFMSVFRRRT